MLIFKDWFQVDDRCWNKSGTIYDIGCWRWDWCQEFLGKIPVVGLDPQEDSVPNGAVLIRAALMPFKGKCNLYGGSLGANTHQVNLTPSEEILAMTWQELLSEHGPANIVKMNIEGGEIPILMSVDHPMADQLVVAFHDWQKRSIPTLPPVEATKTVIDYLSQWYTVIEIFPKFRWFLFLKK